MLTTIRERAQGWIAWVIVFIISVPFALWGINEYFSADEKVVVAEINGNELLAQEFQEVIQRQRGTLRQKFGGKIDSKIFETKAFKLRVLNEMIAQRLISADIRNNNYQISDEQLAAYLRTNPAFQVNGTFSSELYDQAVRSNGLSAPAFENRVRASNIVQQIKEGFNNSVINNEQQLNKLLRLQQEKRDFKTLTLSVDSFVDQAEVSSEDIKKYYDENKSSLMTTNDVRVEYISLSIKELAEQINPDEAALMEYYEERKDRYIEAEQRQAQHILLAVAADADEEEIKRINELASDLTKQAREGEDFSEMAKKYSVDSISSANGGDLGYFEKGVMDQAFDEKAFAMQKDEISEPVRSKFGFHVIKLNNIKPESGKSFAQVKEQISEEYALHEASSRFGQMAEEMQNLVYEQPTSLQAAADALGIKITSSDWFSQAGGEGVLSNRAFVDSAFTEDVLQEGLNSEVVEVGEDTLVALRSLEHRRPQQKPLADVSDEIKTMLINQISKQLVAAKAEEITGLLRSGSNTLAQIAEQQGLQLSEYENVQRAGNVALTPALLNEVFRSSTSPSDSDTGAAKALLENGDHVILSVSKIHPGDPQDVSDEVRERISNIIQQRKGGGLFADYERGLYELADIVIYEDKL
jgi:peptidyl-prolyl cis-trans isomerase D